MPIAHIVKFLIKTFIKLFVLTRILKNVLILFVDIIEVILYFIYVQSVFHNDMTHSSVLNHTFRAKESNITLTEELDFLLRMPQTGYRFWLFMAMLTGA